MLPKGTDSPKRTWLGGPTVCSQGAPSLLPVIRLSAYEHSTTTAFPAPPRTPLPDTPGSSLLTVPRQAMGRHEKGVNDSMGGMRDQCVQVTSREGAFQPSLGTIKEEVARLMSRLISNINH